MAKPTTFSHSKLSIWPGDGASPEDFTSKVCGLTTKGFQIAGTPSDTIVPDCDDPDLPAWVERTMRSLSSSINGAGIMAKETFAFWRDWMLSGEAKNVRVVLDINPIGYFHGSYLLTQFELTGNAGDGKVQTSLQMQSDGPIAWTTGAP